MSSEKRAQINDVLKWILWASISVSSFLFASAYNRVESRLDETDKKIELQMDKTDGKIDKTYEKVQAIESRMIRVEYELKLK
jgi:hypothetical protein